jgi:hypothetical protein
MQYKCESRPMRVGAQWVFWVYFGTSAQAIMIGWSNKSTRVDSSIGWRN